MAKRAAPVRGFLLASLMVLSSCVQSAAPATVVGGTMQVRLRGDWASLDMQSSLDISALSVSLGLYDSLIAFDAKGKIVPYVAESWSSTPTSVTFKIRSDVTCADGTPVTATVVANSFRRYFKVSPSRSRLFGPGPWSVSADDPSRTFTLTLGSPYGDALYNFTDIGIMCSAGVAADPKELADKSFGSGPFVIESFKRGDSITLKARSDWKWGPYGITAQTPGFPQKLIFRVVQDETTAANLLLTGGLDVGYVSGIDVARLRKATGLNYSINRLFFSTIMVMNELPGHPTADEAVREALMTAVDRAAYLQAAYDGFGQTRTSVFPADWECYEPATASLVPKPSIDKAKAVLQSAGYALGPDGKFQKDGKPLTINLYWSGPPAGPEYLTAKFEQAGIGTKLHILDLASQQVVQHTGQYDVSIFQSGLLGRSPAPGIAVFSGPLPPTGSNFADIIDPVLDQEVSAAVGATGSERCADWREVQRRWLEKHELLPLVAPDLTIFARGIDFVQQGYLVEPASLRRRAA